MKKVIVTTSINAPTEAVEKFDALEDWELIVVGDLKTPADYRLDRGRYIGPDEQHAYDPELSDAIGWNCVPRRNFGFLFAHDMGADIVAVVDDDNIPKPYWGKDLIVGQPVEVNVYDTDLPCFDPIGATNYPHLWHRGFPLPLVSQRRYGTPRTEIRTVDVQADFWNGDPDIDAICRMEHAPDCAFDPSVFPFASDTMAPFNSQNTFMRAEVLPDYFMFPLVGRLNDIWASYYAQAKGWTVAFGAPSVDQERNEHNLLKDMVDEYPGYEHGLELVLDLARDPQSIVAYLPGRAVRAFELYRRHFR